VALLAAGCASLPRDVQRTPSIAIRGSTDTELGRIAAAPARDPALSGFRLMSWSAQAFATRLALAQRAQRSIDAQYYVLDDDSTGRALLRALRDAAARGVRVRLLLDDLYTGGHDALLLGLAAHPNVEVRLFNPFMVALRQRQRARRRLAFRLRPLNHRMHNKLFIADGAMASRRRAQHRRRVLHGQRGRQLHRPRRVRGRPGGAALARLFDEYWNSPHVYPLESIVADAPVARGAAARLRGEDARRTGAAAAGPATGRRSAARHRRRARQRPARADLGAGRGLRRLADKVIGHEPHASARQDAGRRCARA
jgi:putative cardiolipin synthase